MSLINDALKRASEAQAKAPAPPPMNFRRPDPEPDHPKGRGFGWAVPVVCCLLALLGLLFVWQWAQTRSDKAEEVRARTAAANPAPLSRPVRVTQRTLPSESPFPANPATVLEAPPAVGQAPPAVAPAPTNAAPPAPPEPPPLKLQGIVFVPGNPSVLINGNTYFVGDTLGEYKIIAIEKASVTVTVRDQVKKLKFGQ